MIDNRYNDSLYSAMVMGAGSRSSTPLSPASGIVNGSFPEPLDRDSALADRRRAVRGDPMEKQGIGRHDTGE